jgi:hypothetical protein
VGTLQTLPLQAPAAFYIEVWTIRRGSNPFALNQAHEQHDHRYNQKDMNETSNGIRGNDSQQPEQDQNDSKNFKHRITGVMG